MGAFARRAFPAQSSELRVTLSGGIASYPEDASDLDGLLLAAAEGRTRASASGGNRLCSAAEQAGPRRLDLAVVSGDEATLTLLVHEIEAEGCRTRVLRSGPTAARALYGPERSMEPRVLLIDADLPGFDALELIERLAAENTLQQTTVIVLSSPSTGRAALQALELGAADLIAKPVDLPVLLQRLRHELESPAPPAGGASQPRDRGHMVV